MDRGREDWRLASEADLAAAALGGDSQAWDEIVRRHSHRVWVALLANGMAVDEAEDLVQEVWVRLVQQQRLGRLRSLALPGLAIAQARWLAKENRRTASRRLAIAGEATPLEPEGEDVREAGVDDDPVHGVIVREHMNLIRRELAACPARAQEVFRAVYGSELRSHDEVAKDLGLSVQRVRQILCEVRARIRAALREKEGDDSSWDT